MPAMASAAEFPHDVLVNILQHIPLKQRMSTCSLVKVCWRAAAAATTTAVIKCKGMSRAAAETLVNQLVSSDSLWTQQVTQICLEQRQDMKVALPQLACPRLLKLFLSGFSLTLTANTQDSAVDSAASHCKGLIQSCPQLQSLSLTRSRVELVQGSSHQASEALSVLTALTALTRLHFGESVYGTTREIDKCVELGLGQLTGLTGLQELGLVQPGRHQLTRLLSGSVPQQQQQPQQLQQQQQPPPPQPQQPVQNAPQQQPHDLQVLACVTKLIFEHNTVRFGPSRTPGLYQLTKLRCLSLKGARVEHVSRLSGMSHLESLVLHNMTSLDFEDYSVYQTVVNSLDTIAGAADQLDVADTGSLLRLLPHLTGLTCLDVLGLARPAAPAAPHLAHEGWTSLMCCSRLQVLRLQHLHINSHSWQLMFEGAEFADLRELRLISAPDSCAGVADMRQMVDACPRLELLQLRGEGVWYTSASVLSRLQTLTSLQLHTNNTEAFSDLWQLRQLRHLLVGSDAHDVVLAHLTELTNLTSFERLEVNQWHANEWGKQVMEEGLGALEFRHSEGEPVWQRILEHCQRSDWCVSHLQHSQGLRAQLASQQQQLQQQTEQMQQQQEQLQQLQHRLQAQDRLMAKQAAELAMLRAQQA